MQSIATQTMLTAPPHSDFSRAWTHVDAADAKGSVFLRDVNVWHSGTANTTGFTRILPCIRFVTVRGSLPVLYSSLENSLWIEYFGKSIRAVKAVMKKKWTPDASPYEKTCTKALSLCRSMHFLDLTLIVQLWNVSKCFHVQLW